MVIIYFYFKSWIFLSSIENFQYYSFQFKEDPSFKPQGGQLGENDMDYDTDEKSMATLRRHLRGAREEYYRYKRLAEMFIAYPWCVHELHIVLWISFVNLLHWHSPRIKDLYCAKHLSILASLQYFFLILNYIYVAFIMNLYLLQFSLSSACLKTRWLIVREFFLIYFQ